MPTGNNIHTELYLPGGWLISAFIVLLLLQFGTFVFVVSVYSDLRARERARKAKLSPRGEP